MRVFKRHVKQTVCVGRRRRSIDKADFPHPFAVMSVKEARQSWGLKMSAVATVP
jgi:hypothetical protein